MHVVVQSLSHVRLSVTPWTAACQAPLSSAVSLTCSNSCPLSQWCYLTILRVTISHPFLLLPSLFPNIRVFSNESALHISWLKYWSFGFSKSSFNEYSGLISFMTDGFDLLAIHGTLKSPLQHHNSKAMYMDPHVSSWCYDPWIHPKVTWQPLLLPTLWDRLSVYVLFAYQ